MSPSYSKKECWRVISQLGLHSNLKWQFQNCFRLYTIALLVTILKLLGLKNLNVHERWVQFTAPLAAVVRNIVGPKNRHPHYKVCASIDRHTPNFGVGLRKCCKPPNKKMTFYQEHYVCKNSADTFSVKTIFFKFSTQQPVELYVFEKVEGPLDLPQPKEG